MSISAEQPLSGALKPWFVTCPKGLEALLAIELQALGAVSVRETAAGVECKGDSALCYRICLWSRLANRVLLPLARFPIDDADDLYHGALEVHWSEHFGVRSTLAVDFVGTSPSVNHTIFGAQRVKDAIVDHFQIRHGERPNVDLRDPDIRINARLANGRVTLSLDLAGESLHRRGYRVGNVTAPLKENLAAALLLRARWPEIAAAGGPLLDPLCGSATLLIEAALMAADIAPGLARHRFGFMAWGGYDAALWQGLVAAARARQAAGLARGLPPLFGFDIDDRALAASAANIEQAGLTGHISLARRSVADCRNPFTTVADAAAATAGLVVTNPPYGARLGEVEELRDLYQQLGATLKREFPGWQAAVFTGSEELGFALGLRAHKRYQLFNGPIPGQLLLFALHGPEAPANRPRPPPAAPAAARALNPGATMLANRLRKNQRRLAAWRQREQIDCYRLYDADLPEYAAAIDCYGEAVHVQEYAPPATISADAADRHRDDLRAAVAAVLAPAPGLAFFKQRRRQRGSDQYQRSGPAGRGVFLVREGKAIFEVNLADYLDTGVFLDHRPLRRRIAALAGGKRLLNLFCYTATATVQAALGGARESLSLDMSNIYLDWAARNLDRNGLDASRHRLLRVDCLDWLAQGAERSRFDLILLDPPTFSNSKKMTGVLDVQRDHVQLIEQAMALLAPGGQLIFSTNFHRFKLAASVAEAYAVEDFSTASLDPDFARHPRIHQCWFISRRNREN